MLISNECAHEALRVVSVEGDITTCVYCGREFYNAREDSIVSRYVARKERLLAEEKRVQLKKLIGVLKCATLK